MSALTCPACGFVHDSHTPFAGTAASEAPAPKSFTVCIECGAVCLLDAAGRPHVVDLGALNMDPDQRREIERVQDAIRKARQDFEAIGRAERIAQVWLDARRGAPPRFRLPHREILLVVDVARIRQRIAQNAAARELLERLLEREPGLRLFMLEILCSRFGFPVDRVSLSALGISISSVGQS